MKTCPLPAWLWPTVRHITGLLFESVFEFTLGVCFSLSSLTEPLPPGTLTISERTTTSLVIHSAVPTDSVVDDYEVIVNPTPAESIDKDTVGDQYQATITGLIAGSQYQVTFRTVSGTEKSDDVSQLVYTSKLTEKISFIQ